MQETWIRPLGWEDLLEKGKATHLSILAWSSPWNAQSMGSQSWTRLNNFHSLKLKSFCTENETINKMKRPSNEWE